MCFWCLIGGFCLIYFGLFAYGLYLCWVLSFCFVCCVDYSCFVDYCDLTLVCLLHCCFAPGLSFTGVNLLLLLVFYVWLDGFVSCRV